MVTSLNNSKWDKDGWRTRSRVQMPTYNNLDNLKEYDSLPGCSLPPSLTVASRRDGGVAALAGREHDERQGIRPGRPRFGRHV